jgi:hypothetical protein
MRIENDAKHATIIVEKGNDFFNYTQLTTVYKGVRFVDLSITVESKVEGVSLDWVEFFVNSKGKVIQMQNETVGLLDLGVKAFAQFIFKGEQPEVEIANEDNPCILSLLYNLQGESQREIRLSVSAFSVTDDLRFYRDSDTIAEYFSKIITDNINSPQEPTSNIPLDVFDYRKALNDWNISYIACRDFDVLPKFTNDPAFSLMFINNEVAILMVKKGVA